MIKLYTASTPNGWKVSIALEELGLPYEVHPVVLAKQEQKQPWFLALNPNGRIPVIVDEQVGATVFESGAILVYLAEKAGRLLPLEPVARAKVLQWVFFQVGGIGPMMGQANVFNRYIEPRIEVAAVRYEKESRRLFEVLDSQLQSNEWLAGEHYSVADIMNGSWVRVHQWSKVSVEGLPHLQRWLAAFEAREAVVRGLAVPRSLNIEDDAEEVKAAGRAIIV